jgi:hypothetical protein
MCIGWAPSADKESLQEPVASGIRCKSAGVVPGFMIRLGDGADSFGLIIWLGRSDGAWPELTGWFEQ